MAADVSEFVAQVLIVEDEAIIAEDIREMLQAAGFSVTGIAASEDDAIALLGETPPDLALVDIRLRGDTGSDGRLAGLRLAEELWVAHRIPVVLVTAFPELLTQESATNSGIFGLVSKPFSSATLIGQVHIALEKSRAH